MYGYYMWISQAFDRFSGKGRHAIKFPCANYMYILRLSKTWRTENLIVIVQGRERCSSESSSNYSLPMAASNKFIAACKNGELNVIKELVESKEVTDPNALTGTLEGYGGSTPLHFACQ